MLTFFLFGNHLVQKYVWKSTLSSQRRQTWPLDRKIGRAQHSLLLERSSPSTPLSWRTGADSYEERREEEAGEIGPSRWRRLGCGSCDVVAALYVSSTGGADQKGGPKAVMSPGHSLPFARLAWYSLLGCPVSSLAGLIVVVGRLGSMSVFSVCLRLNCRKWA